MVEINLSRPLAAHSWTARIARLNTTSVDGRRLGGTWTLRRLAALIGEDNDVIGWAENCRVSDGWLDVSGWVPVPLRHRISEAMCACPDLSVDTIWRDETDPDGTPVRVAAGGMIIGLHLLPMSRALFAGLWVRVDETVGETQ